MYSIFNPELRMPRFSLEENIEVVCLAGKYIVVSPDTGGWVVLDHSELYKMFLPSLTPNIGKELYMRGIAKRNGVSIYKPPDPSEIKRMTYFEFQITDGCNLRCDYCNINSKALNEANKATLNTAEKFVDRIIEYCINNAIFNVTVQFSGGEPFTNFAAMEHTCHYVSERLKKEKFPKKLCFQAQTNLAFPLEAQYLELVKKFQIGLGVSIDGPKKYHDAHRKFPHGNGSWNLIMENLSILKSEGVSVGTISVITPENVSEMKSIVEFFLEIGITGLVLTPLLPVGRGTNMNIPNPSEYVQGLFEVFDKAFIPYYKKTNEIPLERELGLALLNFAQPSRQQYMCWRTPCGAGTNICATTPMGDVFPCGLWVNESEFKLGNIHYNSYDEMISSEIASMLRKRDIKSLEQCASCLYRAWCQSRCPFSAYARYGDIFKPSGQCEFMKELFSELLKKAVDGKLNDQYIHALIEKVLLFY